MIIQNSMDTLYSTEKSLESLLSDYAKHLNNIMSNEKSRKSYISYVRTLDKANGGRTMDWLREAVKKDEPIEFLSSCFDSYFEKASNTKPQSQWKTGLCRLGEFVCGFTNSRVNLRSIKDFERTVCRLVAQSAIFCTKNVFQRVVNGKSGSRLNKKNKGNKYGSWYYCRYKRVSGSDKQKKGEWCGDVKLDDNTYANKAIKYAVLEGLKKYGSIHGKDTTVFSFVGNRFEACHIWANTCYDVRYHTSVANLVLLPRELASLTDHCNAVKDLLKFEVWKRFEFKPEEEDIPQRPQYYDVVEFEWRATPEIKERNE